MPTNTVASEPQIRSRSERSRAATTTPSPASTFIDQHQTSTNWQRRAARATHGRSAVDDHRVPQCDAAALSFLGADNDGPRESTAARFAPASTCRPSWLAGLVVLLLPLLVLEPQRTGKVNR